MANFKFKKGDKFMLAAGRGEKDLRYMGYTDQNSIKYITSSKDLEVTRVDDKGRVYFYNKSKNERWESWVWDWLIEPAGPRRGHLLTTQFQR